MRTLKVNYTKTYSKSIDKEVEIPDDIEDVDIKNWLYDNSIELFEDEITSKSLELGEENLEYELK
jgi:hypothetical protein